MEETDLPHLGQLASVYHREITSSSLAFAKMQPKK